MTENASDSYLRRSVTQTVDWPAILTSNIMLNIRTASLKKMNRTAYRSGITLLEAVVVLGITLLTVSLMNRTLPSAKAKSAPPG